MILSCSLPTDECWQVMLPCRHLMPRFGGSPQGVSLASSRKIYQTTASWSCAIGKFQRPFESLYRTRTVDPHPERLAADASSCTARAVAEGRDCWPATIRGARRTRARSMPPRRRRRVAFPCGRGSWPKAFKASRIDGELVFADHGLRPGLVS